MSELIRLANLCEKATGPDLQLDSWIAHEVHRATGHDVDYYTGSIDSAVTLVPARWYWQVGYTSAFQAWANVYQTHPDHGEKDKNEFHASRPHWDNQRKWTPVLALCHAALRARASLMGQQRSGS